MTSTRCCPDSSPASPPRWIPDAAPDSPNVLTLARYAPSLYRLNAAPDAHEAQLTGLIRSQLLKRFESSPHAFAATCERMAASHDAFMSLLDHGQVATGEALADWVATDSDDMDEVADYLDTNIAELENAADYNTERLKHHATSDAALLRGWAAQARTITRDKDPTLAAICEELASIAAEARGQAFSDNNERDRRKVIIFSYYTDTVDWIYEPSTTRPSSQTPGCRPTKAAGPSAGSDSDHTRRPQCGFRPAHQPTPHKAKTQTSYDILVATDVLAEGGQPPTVSTHHQLRPAVEPDAARANATDA